MARQHGSANARTLRTCMVEQIRIYRWVLLGGNLAGLVVYGILVGPHLYWGVLFGSMLIGSIYAMVMMPIQWSVGSIAERYIPLRSSRAVAGLVAIQVTTLIGSFILATLLVNQLPFHDIAITEDVLAVVLMVAVTASLIGHASFYMWRLYKRLREAEQAALRAELQALRAQINPHFLFNSLNSIAALTRISPERAEEVTQALADLFRYVLHSSNRPMVTLAEELDAIELYLAIERARFGDRLEVYVDVPRDMTSLELPSLTLQPLVENSVKHGLGSTDRACRIDVRGQWSGNRAAILTVTDTGPGFSTTSLKELAKQGYGLANVQERLRHELGIGAGITILPNGVTITIPVGDTTLKNKRDANSHIHRTPASQSEAPGIIPPRSRRP